MLKVIMGFNKRAQECLSPVLATFRSSDALKGDTCAQGTIYQHLGLCPEPQCSVLN